MKKLPLCLMLAFLGITGCARGFDIETPDGFAELEEGDHYAYRATSAEGVVIAVRREVNDPKGNLDFWSRAVAYDLARRGYSAQEEKAVKSAGGVDGRQLRYSTTKDGRPNVFWATVFVTSNHVVVVEAGGDRAHFDDVSQRVQDAINSLDLS